MKKKNSIEDALGSNYVKRDNVKRKLNIRK